MRLFLIISNHLCRHYGWIRSVPMAGTSLILFSYQTSEATQIRTWEDSFPGPGQLEDLGKTREDPSHTSLMSTKEEMQRIEICLNSQLWSQMPGNSVWRFGVSMSQSLRYGVNVPVFQGNVSGPGRVWRNHNWAARKEQRGERTYVAVQHLLVIVETQSLKRVNSAVKVNELWVNMEIFQNDGDSAGFAATSHQQGKGSHQFMPANNMHPLPFI